MNVLGLLRVAMRALAVNKLRSVLTMLGIIIGVAAVIVMIAVGAGAQKRVEDQIRSLGSNLLLILSGTTTSGGVRMGFGSNLTITEDDAAAIPREIPETMSAPALRGTAQLIWGNQNWSTVIFGVTPEYIEVRQSCGVRPLRIGNRLRPCISLDAGSSAASRNVSAKSILRAIASLLVPGLIRAGQRARSGMRIDSSYMNRLSKRPWSPRKKP